jgi:hypothetical protein
MLKYLSEKNSIKPPVDYLERFVMRGIDADELAFSKLITSLGIGNAGLICINRCHIVALLR